VSGFVGKSGWYDLTATKALYWHRYRSDSCRSLADIVHAHIVDGGFRVQEKGNYVRVTGPGLVLGWTDFLFMSIAGTLTAEAFPRRRWS
jgi:hypothetical protein